MAEFVDVIRQFHRMCEANAGCVICPLRGKDGESEMCSISAFVNNPKRIEGEVMSWAAQHPEPVYPSYLEVFGWGHKKTWAEIKDILANPIPADLAKKLNVDPKEVT